MSQPPRKPRSKPQPPEPTPEQTPEQTPGQMIDPHGDAGDVISGVPSLSVDEVEKRIGAKERARGEGVRAGAPARGRAAPATNRRVTLWRDSATILIFVLIALLAARFMLNGSGTATASPTPEPSAVDVTQGPADSGFQFSFVPSLGPPVDPSSRINASPTPIPVITLGPLTVPSAPKNVVAARGNASASVDWSFPDTNGGSKIKSYTVTSKPGGHQCFSTGPTSCTVSHLVNGTAYTFTVTATNAIGTGPASAPSNSVVPAAVPGKPTAVIASPRDGGAFISWTKPAVSGGTPINHYTVTTVTGTPAHSCTATAPAVSCLVSGLTNGNNYTYKVTASNSVGTGLPSAPSNVVTPGAPTAPGAPTGVAASAGDGSASISWTAPSDGGSPITGYTATSSPGGLTCSTVGTSCPVSGLTNGTPYTFTVVATNAIGPSAPSASSNTVTPAGVPGAPTGVTPSQAGGPGTDVVVDWTDPADNGSAITGYTVFSGTGNPTCIAPGAAATTCTFTAGTLAPGTYTFTVAATNGAGTGAGGDFVGFVVS